MPELHMNKSWSITLSTEEFRLVLKALGGRLSVAEEIEKSKILGDCLTRQRYLLIEQALKENEKLIKNMEVK